MMFGIAVTKNYFWQYFFNQEKKVFGITEKSVFLQEKYYRSIL